MSPAGRPKIKPEKRRIKRTINLTEKRWKQLEALSFGKGTKELSRGKKVDFLIDFYMENK